MTKGRREQYEEKRREDKAAKALRTIVKFQVNVCNFDMDASSAP